MLVRIMNGESRVVYVNPFQVTSMVKHVGLVHVPGEGNQSRDGVLLCLSDERTVFVPGVSVEQMADQLDDAM